MTRPSTIQAYSDAAGSYEVEIFEAANAQRIIVCAHGSGVLRGDGEDFFYAVAEHYLNDTVILVDQNQRDGDMVILSPFDILIRRIESTVQLAASMYPGTDIILMAHSMGCVVASQVVSPAITSYVMVTPAAGNQRNSLIRRYGEGISEGQIVLSSEGTRKHITKAYFESIKDIDREVLYQDFLKRVTVPVYAFEAGDEDIVGEERFAHRTMPFTDYQIIPGATHNLHGAALDDFFGRVDSLL